MQAVFHHGLALRPVQGSGGEVPAGASGSRGGMKGWEMGELGHAPGACAAGTVPPPSPSREQELGHVLPLNCLHGRRRWMSFQPPWLCLSLFVCFGFEQPSGLCFGERVSSAKERYKAELMRAIIQ